MNVEGKLLRNPFSKMRLGMASARSLLFMSLLFMNSAAPATAASYATDWIQGHNSRARLIVGGAPASDGTIARYVALELALAPGWKTYWRHPGVSGGIPPQLSWQGSQNLKRTKLKYPAPKRMADPTGEAIGYKKSVVFPIAVEARTPSSPMVVNLKAFYGVCREICIPAEAHFKVTLPPSSFMQSPTPLVKALRRVPVSADSNAGAKPVLKSVTKIEAGAGRHGLMFDVHYPGGTAGADLFAETGDLYPLAMTKKMAPSGSDTIQYKIVIKDAETWKQLAKKGLHLTMVSDSAASEMHVPRP